MKNTMLIWLILICCAYPYLDSLFSPRGDGWLGQDSRCTDWARNATMGAQHALKGHSRKIIPLPGSQILALISDGSLYQVDGIPVSDIDYGNPHDRAFVEESIFYGFDYVLRTPYDQMPMSVDARWNMFSNLCSNISHQETWLRNGLL